MFLIIVLLPVVLLVVLPVIFDEEIDELWDYLDGE